MNTNLNSFIKRNKRNIQNKKLNRHERFNTDYGLDAFNKAKNNEDPYFSSNKKLKILNKNSKLNTGGSLKVLLKVNVPCFLMHSHAFLCMLNHCCALSLYGFII